MAYFVTGATGFIGRRLVERLLENRQGQIHVLVREGSKGRLDDLIERWSVMLGGSAEARIVPVYGDLRRPLLGIEKDQVEELRGKIEHFFHLAAVYDMTAPAQRNTAVNVGGTTHAVELARSLEAGRLHHVSSIAVAGDRKGVFEEAMFDEQQRLPSPYHRTKFESERIVRDQPYVPWRVYRPGIVVGDSQTGEMDKIDGPYYFFKAIERLRHLLPEWVPLVGLDLGYTNIVPVDWVAGALEHIAHEPDLDGRAFHLTDPRPQRVDQLMNEIATAAHAPRFAVSIDKRITDPLPKWPLTLAAALPPLRQVKGLALRELGVPGEVLAHVELVPRFDTREATGALAGTPLETPPPWREYVPRLWDYWEREMDTDFGRGRTLREALSGKHVMITGASSGIGRAAALKVAAAGGVPLLVARNVDNLEEVRAEIVASGGTAYVYAADISDIDSIERLLERVLADHRNVDMLVNNAGRSIRRSIALSYDRFHDFERTIQLNYFGAVKLIIGLLPHMRQRGSGHIVNVSSIGVQTNPPRFSAYVASKAALDAFSRVVASEVVGDGVTFTTIHMPLVRTPMIAPTKMYDAFPAISPDEAADIICEAMRSRPKQMGTRIGRFGEVAYTLNPSAVDRLLHLAYRVFPDSAAAKGNREVEEHVSFEQIAMATLTRGVHW
ncbi:MAG TPA: SDR family oxidoreductase [Solirubrobacteraceae bacterium]|jgi:NAD(P)-dependent dehydrogenase (short-subunit alcohol dehydrogenase family)|nr:SDR family oxidoreductase [Solirubrobacteraceae bacterium]